MRSTVLKSYILLPFVLLVMINESTAQKKKVVKNDAPSGGSPKSWGIGLRLGDPSGITIKKYLAAKKALELSVGRTYGWGGSDRYFNYYYDKNWNKDWKGRGYYDYRHELTSAYAIQLHYLGHNNLDVLLEGMTWYWGVGAQLRSFRYDYWYYDSKKFYYNEHYNYVGIGADGVLGLEYTFADAPISVFLDATLYMEIIQNPFWFQGQAAIGGRYNF